MVVLLAGRRGRLHSLSVLPRKDLERKSSANGCSRLQIAIWRFSRCYGMLILWARPRRLPFTSQSISWKKLDDSLAEGPLKPCEKDLRPWRPPMPIANSGRYGARWMCRLILKPFGRTEGDCCRHQFADRVLPRRSKRGCGLDRPNVGMEATGSAPVVVTEMLSSPGLNHDVSQLVRQLPVLAIRPGFWERAAMTRAKLLASRLRARLADTLIAQSCLDHEVPLITRDRDFRHFVQHAGLELI